ncbi:hypothetical protein P4110_06160 [Pseudomonas aeruginosa]|nr:hypothetical protein [Pseudomonas aeruginosa]
MAFLIWALFIVADWMMVDDPPAPQPVRATAGRAPGNDRPAAGGLAGGLPAQPAQVGDAIAPYCLLLINLAVLACDVLFEWHGVPRFTQLARPWVSSRCSSRSAWRSGPACAWRCCAWPRTWRYSCFSAAKRTCVPTC